MDRPVTSRVCVALTTQVLLAGATYSSTTGTGGTQTHNVSGAGRYNSMYGATRATQYGHSIDEFQTYAS